VLGQLGAIIERHGREEMMGNMVVGDVVQEETSHPAHEGAIYSRGGTAEESEGVVAEMGHGRVGVVKVSEHDDPVVGKSIRNEVILEESRERVLYAQTRRKLAQEARPMLVTMTPVRSDLRKRGDDGNQWLVPGG